MTDEKLMQLLKQVKDTPELGGDPDGSRLKTNWEFMAKRIGFTSATEGKEYHFGDYVQYVLWRVQSATMQPLAVGVSVFAVIFTGWIATVNASFDSVPGDVLYPVKLATERMQISIANPARRARLHSEFAGRRLEEAAAVSVSNKEGKDVRVKAAFDDFKSQVTSAQAELTNLSAEEAVDVAVSMDQKSGEFKVYLSQTETGASEGVKTSVKEVRNVVEQANDDVADTLMKSHEVVSETHSEDAVKQVFRSRLQEAYALQSLTLGRLLAAEAALKRVTDATVAEKFYGQIHAVRYDVQLQAPELADAMDVFAAGGYRKAFDVVQRVLTVLNTAADTVAEIEIGMTTASQP